MGAVSRGIVKSAFAGLAFGVWLVAAPRHDQPQVIVSQCADLLKDGTCVLDAYDPRLSLFWSDSTPAPVAILEGKALTLQDHQAVAAGTLATLRVPAFTSPSVLRIEVSNQHHSSVKLQREAQDQCLARALALRQEGRSADALHLLDPAERTCAAATELAQHERLALRGRLYLDLNDLDAAVLTLQASMASMYAAGLRAHAIRDAVALAFVWSARFHDPERATAVLERARGWSSGLPEFESLIRYQEGIVASESADLRRAIAAFREARDEAQRYSADIARLSWRELADLFSISGQGREAIEIHRQIIAGPLTLPCERSDAYLNYARSVIAYREAQPSEQAGGAIPESALDLLEQAEQALGNCIDPWRHRNILVERLLQTIAASDQSGARKLQARLQDLPRVESPVLEAWEHEGAGRLALLEGSTARAVAAFRVQLALSERNALSEETFRAHVALGNALETSGDAEAALAEYRAAEQGLDDRLLRVGFGDGVHGFARLRQHSARDLVRALIARGRFEEAAAASRKARVRSTLQAAQWQRIGSLSPTERGRWFGALQRYVKLREQTSRFEHEVDLPVAEAHELQSRRTQHMLELRAALDAVFQTLSSAQQATPDFRQPQASELWLLYQPKQHGFTGFALTSSGTYVHELVAPEPRADQAKLSDLLIAPFRAQITSATRVVLLLPEELWNIDFHHLRLEGRPLLAWASVSYALDLPELARPHSAAKSGSQLIVADPTRDLPGSAEEGSEIAALLAQRAAPVVLLAGADAALQKVRTQLQLARLFHYAGHGQLAGLEGYESALPLAADTQLLVGDILTLPAAPEQVVLSACEGAKMAKDGGVSVAHAFALAGGREIVAAPRTISDAAARSLARALYAHGAGGGTSLENALRAAQLSKPDDSDAWSFRVITP